MKNHRDKALYKIDDTELCPCCGAMLLIKSSQHGPFLGCSSYPNCDYTQPLKERKESQIIKELPEQACELCQNSLVVRQGQYGLFICCVNYPQCDYIAHKADNSDNVSKKHSQEDESVVCPKCQSGQLTARQSRFGKIFWGCSNYPSCTYLLNSKPVNATCPQCHSSVLVEKKRAKGQVYACANKRCDFETNHLTEINQDDLSAE